nr:immunoglobulin light chain junction region [Macaca mulatta]
CQQHGNRPQLTC